jgi:predicted TIM-barrel enzyme
MDLPLLITILPADLARNLAVSLHAAADAVAEKNATKLKAAGQALFETLITYLNTNDIDVEQVQAVLQSVLGVELDLASYVRDAKKGAPN